MPITQNQLDRLRDILLNLKESDPDTWQQEVGNVLSEVEFDGAFIKQRASKLTPTGESVQAYAARMVAGLKIR